MPQQAQATSLMDGADSFNLNLQYVDTTVFATSVAGSSPVGIASYDSFTDVAVNAPPNTPDNSGSLLTSGSAGPGSATVAPVAIYGTNTTPSGFGNTVLVSPSATAGMPDGFGADTTISYSYGTGPIDTFTHTATYWGSTADLRLGDADTSAPIVVDPVEYPSFYNEVGLQYQSVSSMQFRVLDWHASGWDGVTFPPPPSPDYYGLTIGTLDMDAAINFIAPPLSGPATTAWIEVSITEHISDGTGSALGTNLYTYNSLTDGPSMPTLSIKNGYFYTIVTETHWIVPHGVDPIIEMTASYSLARFDGTTDPVAVPEPGTCILAAFGAVMAGARARRRGRAAA